MTTSIGVSLTRAVGSRRRRSRHRRRELKARVGDPQPLRPNRGHRQRARQPARVVCTWRTHRKKPGLSAALLRADDGARTHDPQLGKRALRRVREPVLRNHAKAGPLGTARIRSVSAAGNDEICALLRPQMRFEKPTRCCLNAQAVPPHLSDDRDGNSNRTGVGDVESGSNKNHLERGI